MILVTARTSKEDLVAGLDSGADDYVTKPVDRDELQARLKVGQRIIKLQRRLAERVDELQEILKQMCQLQGLLPHGEFQSFQIQVFHRLTVEERLNLLNDVGGQ